MRDLEADEPGIKKGRFETCEGDPGEGQIVNWKVVLAIVLTLAVTATLLLGLDAYSMQETVLVLLLVAAAVLAAFLSLVTFVLFEEGARSGFVWLKARISRMASSSGPHVSSPEAMQHPRPLK